MYFNRSSRKSKESLYTVQLEVVFNCSKPDKFPTILMNRSIRYYSVIVVSLMSPAICIWLKEVKFLVASCCVSFPEVACLICSSVIAMM